MEKANMSSSAKRTETASKFGWGKWDMEDCSKEEFLAALDGTVENADMIQMDIL
jgi:hypothetical protein